MDQFVSILSSSKMHSERGAGAGAARKHSKYFECSRFGARAVARARAWLLLYEEEKRQDLAIAFS